MSKRKPSPPTIALDATTQAIVDAVIERAEQACRYALKHQDFSDDDSTFRDAWEVAAAVCEGAIRPHVMRHIEGDIANEAKDRAPSLGQAPSARPGGSADDRPLD